MIYPDDVEILEKLANILIIEKRYEIAMEIYKKIISLSGETEGSLYIMTHLSHELAHHEELYAYARRYQKNWPNNPEILSLLAEAEVALGQRQDAIQTLIKLKNLTPYNSEIMDMIAKLTTEEELAGNFGNQ
jgi:tetratricopeptide (TPR) repeat protein